MERAPTTCERALAWAINVRVASALAGIMRLPPATGGLAAVVAMLTADNKRPEEQGNLRIPIQLLTLPGSVTMGVLRANADANRVETANGAPAADTPDPDEVKPNPRPASCGC